MKLKIVLLTLLVVLVLTGVWAGSALAQPTCMVITYVPDGGTAGTSVSFSGSDSYANSTFIMWWDAVGTGTQLYSGTSDGSGNFSGAFTIPANATLGTHQIIFDGQDVVDNDVQCPQNFLVSAASVQADAYIVSTSLPATGMMLLFPAAGFAALGLGTAIFRRRSR